MDPAVAKHVGVRLLDEIEEESLEELLAALRTAAAESTTTTDSTAQNHHHALHNNRSNTIKRPQPPSPALPIPALQRIVHRYQTATRSAPPPLISVSGRYLPFLYHLISLLISSAHRYTVAVVDPESRFDVTRLLSSSFPLHDDDDEAINNKSNTSFVTEDDLGHVYVFTPPHIDVVEVTEANNNKSQQQQTQSTIMESVKSYMLYGQHSSRDREWWGTIVINPTFSSSSSTTATKGDVVAGFRGWLRIDRDEVPGFPVGMSAEEALAERSRRQEQVEKAPWVASCAWGRYDWRE